MQKNISTVDIMEKTPNVAGNAASNVAGKKIFLLYPHSVIRDDMLDVLIMAGYETYTLVDEEKGRKLMIKFPGSIMFINIDEGLKELEWEIYIKDIQQNPKTKDCRLGIMSYNQDKELMQKYLMELAIPCGYIQLKLGLHESTRIILNALEVNEARGRRKCIRANCDDDRSASINFKGDTGMYQGKILDISASGIAARFEKLASLPLACLLPHVQLRLRGGLVMTNMIYMGQRQDDKRIYILLFDNKLSEDNKFIIHRYIKQCLQRYVDRLAL